MAWSMSGKTLVRVAGFVLLGVAVYVSRDRSAFLRRISLQLFPPEREIYVADLAQNLVIGFPVDGAGTISPAPSRLIRGANTGLHAPVDVALDRSGNIYVLNKGGHPPGSLPSITIYVAHAHGNERPARIIQAVPYPDFGGTSLDLADFFHAIAVRRRPRNILITDANGSSPSVPRVAEFSMMAGQDVPTGGVVGPQTGLTAPRGIAVDVQQRLFIAQPDQDEILIYSAQGNQFVHGSAGSALRGNDTGLDRPLRLTFGPGEHLYVLNNPRTTPNRASVTTYEAGASGNARPIRRIGGPFAADARLFDPAAIAVDANGRVFLADGRYLKVFPPNAAIGQPPAQTFTHPEMNVPAGLAVR